MSISGETNDILPYWVKAMSEEEATKRDAWPPRAKDREIDWERPTFEVYHDPGCADFSLEFKAARQKLDYSYHRNPAKTRQELQDIIMRQVVKAATPEGENQDNQGEETSVNNLTTTIQVIRPSRPWLIFTSGPMGVGKGYVLSKLYERGLFPLNRFLHIDPDMMKSELPEMAGFLKIDAASAATKVHRESTQMADTLLEFALQSRLPTLVDGSLRDVDYYHSLIDRIRSEFCEYQLAIIHVTASAELIRSRARARAEKTGRAVPEKLLEESIEQVPKSVEALSPHVDITYSISNEDDTPIQIIKASCGDKISVGGESIKKTPSLSWEDFRATWWRSLESKENKLELELLPSWCDSQCPGISEMSFCSRNGKCIQAAKNAFSRAYPSFCPSCTLASDAQCGICVHNVHWCACEACRSSVSLAEHNELCSMNGTQVLRQT